MSCVCCLIIMAVDAIKQVLSVNIIFGKSDYCMFVGKMASTFEVVVAMNVANL